MNVRVCRWRWPCTLSPARLCQTQQGIPASRPNVDTVTVYIRKYEVCMLEHACSGRCFGFSFCCASQKQVVRLQGSRCASLLIHCRYLYHGPQRLSRLESAIAPPIGLHTTSSLTSSRPSRHQSVSALPPRVSSVARIQGPRPGAACAPCDGTFEHEYCGACVRACVLAARIHIFTWNSAESSLSDGEDDTLTNALMHKTSESLRRLSPTRSPVAPKWCHCN